MLELKTPIEPPPIRNPVYRARCPDCGAVIFEDEDPRKIYCQTDYACEDCFESFSLEEILDGLARRNPNYVRQQKSLDSGENPMPKPTESESPKETSSATYSACGFAWTLFLHLGKRENLFQRLIKLLEKETRTEDDLTEIVNIKAELKLP